MEILETIKYHITQLDEKTFIAYLGGFLLGMILIVGGLFYFYSSAIEERVTELNALNEQRTNMQTLFETDALVKKQEQEVKKMLQEDEYFKIGGYFKKVTDKLNLEKSEMNEINTVQLAGKYRETILMTRFQTIDMKQICDLLSEIGLTKRVYIKSLDIVRSTTAPTKLDVTLAIGTLENEIPGT
jgi:hypothetical protein